MQKNRSRLFLSSILVGTVVASTSAIAQDEESFGGDEAGDEEGDTDSDDSDEGEEASAAPSDDGEVRAVSSDDIEVSDDPASTEAPATYTVQTGDTLWNLSAKFLSNPWYWPKVWSYNPQIDNPNWIQPGSVIRFYQGSGEAPVEVRSDGEGGGDGDGDGNGSGNGGDGDGSGGDGDGDGEEGDDYDFPDTESIAGFEGGDVKAKLEALSNRKGIVRRRTFFIPAEKVKEAGSVDNSPLEKNMLTTFDPVWVKFKAKPEKGTRMQVFRVTRDLVHPVSGARLGKVVEIVGEMRVDSAGEGKVLCLITEAYDLISRGDYVAVLEEAALDRVEPTPNEVSVKGYVVDATRVDLRTFGQHHIVFVDKGESDGVKIGNTFTVVRATDPVTGDSRGLTDEVVGTVAVTDVRSKTSIGVLIYSNREIGPGDRIEMRVAE